jgi:alpha-mannosidase
MKKTMTRRTFLRAGAAGGAGMWAAWPLFGRIAAPGPDGPGICLTVCNHWSYIGIGWQLGIESCVLSAVDGMEMADRPPHVKTCINLDARAYEFMAEKFPEVAARLRTHLAAGKVELIGGTYGQPMGTTISGESNIRQIVMGREVIRKALGYSMATFLEEEEFTHPQIPQIAALAGFRYASLAQLDTWGRAGCPRTDVNVLGWKGIDGTVIPSVPKNALFGYSPDLKKLAAADDFQKLKALGTPLIFAWEEYGWESPEEPAYLSRPAKYSALGPVEFVTIKEYLDKYGSRMDETVYFPMDAWNKSLTWGLGGDQVRVLDRKVDGLLLAAELFDAVAAANGLPSRASDLDKAWRDLLASQSHDVGLCEYSRWQGDRMAPFDRVEDKHNFTWGAIGYNHLDAAQTRGQAVLDAALGGLAGKIDTRAAEAAGLAAVVFNPHTWPRTGLASTGRLYPLPPQSRDIVVRDRAGRVVPSQMAKSDRDPTGDLVMAEVSFKAQVPSAGYDTYALQFSPSAVPPAKTDLRIDETRLTLENEFLRVRLDPATGGVASLAVKASGREMLDPAGGPFPRFTGRPNPLLPMRPNAPASYDSGTSKARIDWLDRGPLWATVRAQHEWTYLKFETRVTLAAGSPYVEVVSRVLAQVPPHPDIAPADIKEGYWLSFVPGFPVTRTVRDFPFGVEETKNPAFHGLTFVDLVGADRGLLVLHPGTQWFEREPSGRLKNLLMREWEGYFSKEYGWPIYAEYRHALMPHEPSISNADRLQAAAAFARPLDCRTRKPAPGALPPARTFMTVSNPGIRVAALRKKLEGGYELRVVETEGRRTDAVAVVHLGLKGAIRTDLLGNRLADAAWTDDQLAIAAEPWKILTYVLD